MECGVLTSLIGLFSLLIVPWTILLLCVVFAAIIGKSLGVRKLYIKFLLCIFEYGRRNIEMKKQGRIIQDDSEDEGIGEELKGEDHPIIHRSAVYHDYQLISRKKELILVPELTSKRDKEKDAEKEDKIHFDMKTWLKSLDYIRSAMESIVEDQVTSRFEAEELKNWNFLTRTNQGYEFISIKLTLLWLLGFVIRYGLLLPIRISVFCFAIVFLVLSTAILGKIPEGSFKRWLNHRCYVIAFRILTRTVSASITIHNKQWRPQRGSICVANHTSPIDCIILSNDNCYSLIGQSHGGVLGIIQRALNRASPHVWFERSETKDRGFVLRRLRKHTSDPKNPPMLIFPEGTCINNTSVMQFKKGSFEVGCPIYPVAIKYDPRFGDAFWNSNKYSMLQYLYMMMTSWAIVCEVWYLPPVQQKEGEGSIDYANRVKHLIAEQGGLVDLVW